MEKAGRTEKMEKAERMEKAGRMEKMEKAENMKKTENMEKTENYAAEPFFCMRGGLRIRGMQYLPGGHEEGRRYPAIIVSHGFTGDYTSEESYCREFARLGYAAFCFSFCGGSSDRTEEGLKSEGSTTEATIGTEVEDLIAVKDYVAGLAYVDSGNLILMGCSQGGMVSGLAAAKCGKEISKLIMVYPALCIPDHARRGCLGGAHYDVEQVPDIIDCQVVSLGKKFHEEAVGMDVFLELEAYEGPVLILQGMDDTVVNYSYAVRAKESYRPGQCRLQLIREMGHGAEDWMKESIVDSVRQFLLGRREQLTIPIIITRVEEEGKADYKEVRIYFTGYCDTELFRGTVLPGGCDTQKHFEDGTISICADYTLEGVDQEGQNCRIHIVNRRADGEWKPRIETDSRALAWIGEADATAVLEGSSGGPTVRIFFE